jgi:hypothetical protein
MSYRSVTKVDAMAVYRNLVRSGKYIAARTVLHWLKSYSGKLVLGLGDSDWEVETQLEKFGYRGFVTSNGNYERFYLQREGR